MSRNNLLIPSQGARFKKFDVEADAKMFAAGKSMKEIGEILMIMDEGWG